jgi:membrane-bound ClpP family serine protease
MQTINNSSLTSLPSIGRYLQAGLIAGVVGAVIANIYNAIYQGISGQTYPELTVFTIIFASLIPGLLGSLIYYWLSRSTRQPRLIFTVVGLVFTVLSVVPNFVSPMDPAPGFASASTPLHFIVALSALILIPTLVKTRR